MARGLARGWGEPVLVTDSGAGSGRAAALAAEVGGEAVASNAELAGRADIVVLCHKPAQLAAVAAEAGGSARAVVSVLAATPVAAVEAVYPRVPVLRMLPNTPVEIRRGVIAYARGGDVPDDLERDVLALFGRLGTVVGVPDRLIDVAMGTMSNFVAYVALLVEAQIDASVRHGLAAPDAARMACESVAGTGALLLARECDPVAVRRGVTSPGGTTARGVAALERGGIRAAVLDALDAVLEGSRA